MTNAHVDDTLARHNVKVLVIAQAVLGSQMPMLFIVGGLAGQTLAPVACYATLGISMILLGSMTTAPWLSAVMQKWGRRIGFVIGGFGGMVGALVSAYGILADSFTVFLIGSYLSGIYQSSQGFLRFAGTDNASDAFRPKAVSYVLAGGLVAAIIGPQIVKVTFEAAGMVFVGTYLAVAAVNGIGIWIYLFLKPSNLRQTDTETLQPQRSVRELLTTPGIAVAVICGMVSYALMTLMMTSAPLAIVGCGFSTNNAADVVMAHVLAMFVPSFFTGHLINRFGVRRIVATGLFILFCAGVVALLGTDLAHFFGALILLGIGWNFGFIGATTMLATQHAPHERGRVQGMNDMFVFGSLTLASLASGGLMNCVGTDAVTGWNSVTYAMLPFLALAGSALIWLTLSEKKSSKPA